MKPLALCIALLLGISSSHGQHEEAWSREEYPDPQIDVDSCGMGGMKAYMCDPSNVLKGEEAQQLNAYLGRIRNTTECPCADYVCKGSGQGYKIGIAIMKQIIPSKTVRTREDENDPALVIEQNLYESRLFAYTLLQTWRMGACGEDVIILYSVVDNVFYTMTGDVAQKKLTSSIIGEIAMNTRQLMRPSSAFEGLLYLVKQYEAVFQGTYQRPAYRLSIPTPQAVRSSSPEIFFPSILSILLGLLAALL